jgi:hypothetical protein
MAILMLIEFPGASTDDYDGLNREMGIDPHHLPDGLISHVVGPTDQGLLIADTWESEDALDKFFEQRVGPAMAKAGVAAGEPRVFPVHNHIRQGSGTDAGVIVVIESDGFSPDDYDNVTAEMPAHAGDGSNHPAVSHVAAVSDGGMVFVDVWDSPESVGGFFEEQVGPATAAAGADLGAAEPRFVPVHNRFAAQG